VTHSEIDYKYFIADLITGEIVDELLLTNVKWGLKTKAAGQFTAQAPLTGKRKLSSLKSTTTPGNRALYLVRNGVVVWGGIVWTRQYKKSTKYMDMTALSFEAYLDHRVIWRRRNYTDVDVYRIFRDLLHGIQVDFDPSATPIAGDPSVYYPTDGTYTNAGGRPDNASIGIADGSGTSPFDPVTNTDDFRGNELKFLGETISALSDHQNKYFEYRIEPSLVNEIFTKTLVIFAPEPNGSATNLIFTDPGAISDYTWSDTMEGAATRYWVTGDGQGPDKVIGNWVNDSLLTGGQQRENNYNANFPLYDEVDLSRHSRTKSQATLDNYAEKYGKKAEPPIVVWDVTVLGGRSPVLGTYRPGQWAKFIIQDDDLGDTIKFTRRILEMNVTVPDSGSSHESVELVLTNESGPDSDVV
jgi:hypothetical protein